MKKTTPRQKPTINVEEIIDYDALWKDFISEFLIETVQATMPDLWAAIDWTVPPVFLEQEFINALRGKFKIKDKRKYTDKLVRLRLLTGEDHYILFHVEVQNQLESDFSRRMFIYKSLGFLRYNTEKFTALAIFIGKPPGDEHKMYQHEEFGTKTTYKYNIYVVAEQDPTVLEVSNNLFDLGALAVKYTLDTEGNDARRFQFKRRLFELTNLHHDISIERIHKFLTFVDEYMNLKPELENEFREETPYFESFKSDKKMHTTWRTRLLAESWYRHATGKTFQEELAEKEAEKEAEMEAEKVKNILSMKSKTDFSAEKIADILSCDLAFVQETLANQSKE